VARERIGALGGLGQAVLDALPDRAAVVDADGRVVAVNARWRDVVFEPGIEPARIGIGDDVAQHFRTLRERGANEEVSEALADVADALDDVLAGRLAEYRRELPAPRGPGYWEVIRVVALSDPAGGALLVASDVSELVLAERRLAHVAAHDPLTGLPNRVQLLEWLEAALDRPERGFVAVVEVDIDFFSAVNATVGPQGGDRLLVVVGRRLQAALGAGALVARTGDDDFTVVLDELDDPAGALVEADRLLGVVTNTLVIAGQEVSITASAGVAIAAPGPARPDDLLRDADLATRRAKEQGRGRIAVAHHAQRSAVVQRVTIEQSLRRALERRELWLEYQPEIAISNGRVVGAEALLRWEHPTLGALQPDSFVNVAEETGLIAPIGEWVLRTACREAAGWDLPDDELFVAVNVSGQQLADPSFPALVDEALHDAGLPATRLCIEVTETAVVSSWELARNNLERVRRLGVRVAVDDFGTGYSSFSHLVRLPIDIVKIDGSLVSRLGWDPVERAVVESVVTLARRLDLSVVAEGVEDSEQLAVLQSLGCDVAQGFHTAPPGDSAQLVGAVRARRA
jgi:diguanylate cyclase (GGDEF)-like protein